MSAPDAPRCHVDPPTVPSRGAVRKRTRGLAGAFCQVLALDLRLEGVGPADLVAALGISHEHAVAVLDGHPSAVTMRILKPLCGMAGIDLVQALQAVEQQQAGGGA